MKFNNYYCKCLDQDLKGECDYCVAFNKAKEVDKLREYSSDLIEDIRAYERNTDYNLNPNWISFNNLVELLNI